MFISTEMKNRLLLAGFGETHIAVLCDWYQESKDANASCSLADQELALFSVLDNISENEEALCYFIIENMYVPSAHQAVLAWCFKGIVPPPRETVTTYETWGSKAPQCVVVAKSDLLALSEPISHNWEEFPYMRAPE